MWGKKDTKCDLISNTYFPQASPTSWQLQPPLCARDVDKRKVILTVEFLNPTELGIF